VIVDRFTKYVRFFPVSTTTDAAELAELFHNEWELDFGPPHGIVSDRGSLFTSAFWSALCYHSRVKRRLSTAFHPQTDGQTERMNQILEHYLRCYVGDNPAAWPALLKQAQCACNRARNATTGLSPSKALLGYQPDFRIDLEGELPQEGEMIPAAEDRIEKLHVLRRQLQDHWACAIQAQQRNYDKRHTPRQYKRGDLVGLSTKNLRLKTAERKLAPRFIGPFRVLEKIGLQAYRLALPDKYARLHNVFPVQLLEPWHNRAGEGHSMPMPDLEDDDEWEVEEVKAEESYQGTRFYLVKWAGWPAEYNQWVPEEDMNCPSLIRKFEKSRERAGKGSPRRPGKTGPARRARKHKGVV